MDLDFTTPDSLDSWMDDYGLNPVELDSPKSQRSRTLRPNATVRQPNPDFSDDRVLVAHLEDGDDRAYAFLIASHQERMRAVARRFFSEEEDVRDAVQDAFFAAFRSIGRFEGKAAISTWLHRVVVNACLMKIRSRRRKPESSLTPIVEAKMVSRVDTGAQSALEGSEQSRWVQQAVASLPEPHRSVIRLRDLEERDTRETARVLEISPAAVKTRLHRARTLLRSQLMESVQPIPRSA